MLSDKRSLRWPEVENAVDLPALHRFSEAKSLTKRLKPQVIDVANIFEVLGHDRTQSTILVRALGKICLVAITEYNASVVDFS